MHYPYEYYRKLGELYLELADIMKYAEQIEMNKDILLENYVKESRKDVIEKLGDIRYKMKEMGVDLNYHLKGDFWNEKTNVEN